MEITLLQQHIGKYRARSTNLALRGFKDIDTIQTRNVRYTVAFTRAFALQQGKYSTSTDKSDFVSPLTQRRDDAGNASSNNEGRLGYHD
jgi:hypothetical protein